ncbi:LacI family DNA-binding transcriptional regulator [Agromyces mangrovi Wang et al. 2018]|uniref:LacI family DNA-binding transcriptional regulator n=1 Tax=Agromyces mangrovi TaxID=1858653 RepID=UPI0025723FC7|nr:LacI family DNA-binding transcriptional regulator [Agromyces mangrovi]
MADLAGVNPSTVSRALGKPGRVSAKTEARIRAAAAELDFRMNPMARALPTGRTNTLGLVVADITNPMVFGVVRGAEQAASQAGFTLVIAESQESGEAEATAIERILPGVDGMVLATTRLASDRIARLAAHKPVVLINRAVEGVPSVLPDVDTGVGDLVAHLDDHGHRTVAFLAGPAASWMSERRWAALLDAAEARGIAIVEIGPNPPTIEGGRAAYRRLRASHATAAIAYNDLMAIGVMQEAATHGVDVPSELSVAGFDDIFGSELIVPALTTVRAQLVLAGERAVGQLLAMVGANGHDLPDDLLATTLVVRGSTGPAASA